MSLKFIIIRITQNTLCDRIYIFCVIFLIKNDKKNKRSHFEEIWVSELLMAIKLFYELL
jgi:hypothetical protein